MTVQSLLCTLDSHCESDQICGTDPKQCFTRFNMTEYADYCATTGYQSTPPGDLSSDIDISILLDGDLSASLFFSSGPAFNFIDLVFPGMAGYWVHRMNLVLSNEPSALGLYINGYGNVYSTFDVRAIDSKAYYTFTGINNSYPFFVKNFTIQFLELSGNPFLFFSIDVYGAYNSPEPTLAPTEAPTGLISDNYPRFCE